MTGLANTVFALMINGGSVSAGWMAIHVMLKSATITKAVWNAASRMPNGIASNGLITGNYAMSDLLSPISPGEILKEEFMDPYKITCNRLARDLDVPANRISEIVAGRRAITADTALRLGIYFGIDAQFWLNLQTEYDLQLARQTTAVNLAERIRPLNSGEHRSAAM